MSNILLEKIIIYILVRSKAPDIPKEVPWEPSTSRLDTSPSLIETSIFFSSGAASSFQICWFNDKN